ncbi:MAG: rod shape-determining protein RodA [Clostridiales bacterium]|jgi:rod shape determining protein RodA|nr:rod shape-determining protein RodA [Clostridiales bacterium]
MQRIKTIFNRLDTPLFILVITTSLLGILIVSSATSSFDNHIKFVIIQSGAFLFGLFALFVISFLGGENIANFSKWLAGISIVLLVAVLLVGIGGSETGTTGWFDFGLFSIQPSELVKVAFIITLAKHIEYIGDDINYIKNIGFLLLHAAIPIGLILLQPDYGTAMVFLFIFIAMLFAAGINWRYLGAGFGIFAFLSPIMYFFILNDIQRNRILSFINPEVSLSSGAYQVSQSKLAIGSGQIFGRQLFSGPLTQLGLLPEKQTDMIYAVAGEELGFIGCIVILLLLTAIILRCIYLSTHAKSRLVFIMTIGVAAYLFCHMSENILMCLGLMPVTGIPLPFISYGGSSMLTSMLAISLVITSFPSKKGISF